MAKPLSGRELRTLQVGDIVLYTTGLNDYHTQARAKVEKFTQHGIELRIITVLKPSKKDLLLPGQTRIATDEELWAA